jgi:hypothetical protein
MNLNGDVDTKNRNRGTARLNMQLLCAEQSEPRDVALQSCSLSKPRSVIYPVKKRRRASRSCGSTPTKPAAKRRKSELQQRLCQVQTLSHDFSKDDD